MPEKKLTFKIKAKAWTNENNLHGPHAFLRYVMLTFVECISATSDQFVFKGGNLLWLYIKTPRSTVDVDFATRTLKDHGRVKALLEAACVKAPEGISFSVQSFNEINKPTEAAAAVTISYQTDEGAGNTFELDIVYNLDAQKAAVPSPIHNNLLIQVSPLENIIADKIAACHRFTGGNTRMKDFDDLWRISRSQKAVDRKLLEQTLSALKVVSSLDLTWSNAETEPSWQVHRTRYPDLPDTLTRTIEEINSWLKKL